MILRSDTIHKLIKLNFSVASDTVVYSFPVKTQSQIASRSPCSNLLVLFISLWRIYALNFGEFNHRPYSLSTLTPWSTISRLTVLFSKIDLSSFCFLLNPKSLLNFPLGYLIVLSNLTCPDRTHVLTPAFEIPLFNRSDLLKKWYPIHSVD